MNVLSSPRRLVLALALAAGGLAASAPATSTAFAQAPVISTTQPSLTPHGALQLSGSGFDPSTPGHPVMVDLALVNSGGAFPLGVAQTDAQGGFSSTGLALPLAIDVPATNEITAREEMKTALGASILLPGALLSPTIANSQTTTVHLGDQISIQAAGFPANDTLSISLGSQPVTPATGPTTITTDATGAISATVVIPLNTRTGTQNLTLIGSATGTGQSDQATAVLNLQPPAITNSLVVIPNPAAVGTALELQAGGFQPNEPVTFTLRYFDIGLGAYAIKNSPASADPSGGATALLSIPPTADATRPATVVVNGNVSGVGYAQPLTFGSLTQITFSPPIALPGAQVRIMGSGFVGGENLYATTRLFKPPVGAVAVVDSTGHFTATETILPTAPAGAPLVVALSGSGGDDGSVNYVVAAASAPSVQVAPSAAPAGAQVVVTGQGMGAGESVGFSLTNLPLAASGGAAISDPLGGFTATVTLPAGLAPGPYQLQAQGLTSGITARTSITLTPIPRNQWYFAEGFTGKTPTLSFHESLTVLNPNTQPAVGSVTYQFPDGSTRSIPITVKPRSLLVEDVNKDVGDNLIVSALIQTDRNVVTDRIITRKNAKGQDIDTDTSPGQSAPQSTWYFAEGYSGISFQPYLTVQNPADRPITITAILAPPSGAPTTISAALPPFGRYTLNLRGALPGKSFSTTVTGTGPIVAERVEYWGDGAGSAKFGAGVKPGVSTPGTSWYFGYASVLAGDQSFISLLNPNAQSTKVTAQFYDGTGKDKTTTTVTVQPGQRATLILQNLLGKNPHSPVAIQLTSVLPIVAEEAQYFQGSPNIGSHTGAAIEGRAAVSGRWSFAGGNTASTNEYEYVFNPAAKATVVTGTFLGADGQVVSASYPIPARTVVTIAANAVPGLHKGAHGSIWTTKGNAGVVVVQVLRGADGRSALADQGIPG
ncbi:MAG TPA: hypothetical protein VNL71_01720 [Chloroflexota bacterium]|nr:hypothetical protein [Chloroflexota bacterium]